MITKLILFLTLWSNILYFSNGQKCDESGLRKLDSNFAKLLVLGASGRSFPEDKQAQLKKFCDQTNTYLRDIDKYKNKCMKQSPKQVTGVVVYSVRNALNQYCKKDTKKLTELIQATPCANKAKVQVDQCYSTLIDRFQGANNAEVKSRIPHTCCEYYKFLECLKDKAVKNKNCNEKQVEVVSNFIREIFGNVVDLICGDFVEGSDKCQSLGPTPNRKKEQRKTKSFMLPLIDSLSSLPEA